MNKILKSFLSIFLISVFLVSPKNSFAMAADQNEVANKDNQLMSTCVTPDLIYYEKNSSTKEVTFLVTGTPGDSATIYVYKYLGDLVSAHYVALNSLGNGKITFKVNNGSYEATLKQSCGGTDGPLFFTMN